MASRFTQAWRAAVFAIALATAGLAHAANDYFLEIDGIPGESNDVEHKNWIDIDSFSWGLTAATVGTGGSKATFSDFAWAQPVDASTPKWFLKVATGTHIKKVTLDVTKGAAGSKESFFQMIFTNTRGTGLTVSGSTELLANASMTSGETVTLRYRPQDDKGAFGGWVEGSFDIKAGSTSALFSGDERVLLGLFGAGGDIVFDSGAVVAVPEPATTALLLAGLAVLACRRRRG